MMNIDPNEKRYIAVIGLSGAGKTTFSQLMSKKLNIPMVDTDEMIVKMSGHTIPELFAVSEAHFREWEAKVLGSIEPDNKLIVSCGGGIIKTQACRDILKKNAIVLYIDRPPANICADVDISGRPMLKAGAEQIFKLHEERKALYEEAADVVIPNTGTIDETLNAMIDAVQMLL